MSFMESIYMSRYNSLLKRIDDLNKKNVKGYDTFKEYVLSDEIMISYFNELKKLEKNFSKIHVDSYETFEENIYSQLRDIYSKMLNKINNKSNEQERKNSLLDLKNDIRNSYGHGCDNALNIILKDLESLIDITDKKTKEVLQLEHKITIEDENYEFPKVELLNEETEIKDVIQSEEFNNCQSKMIFGLIDDTKTKIIDIKETSHILIAGTTGIGKTTLLDNIALNIIYKSTPYETKLLILDANNNGFKLYNGIPHLLIPVVTDAKKSVGALAWVIQEIVNRNNIFSKENTENIEEYNKKMESCNKPKIPTIIVIIDEISSIVNVAKDDVEEALIKITQLGKKAGIFLILSTNRPSTDIVSGAVKANIYTRISFFLPAKLDSRLILDTEGAEKLGQYGDILFKTIGLVKPVKYHCPNVSSDGIKKVVSFLRHDIEASNNDIQKNIDTYCNYQLDDDTDPFLMEAIETAVETGQASTSFIQRRFKVGPARAGRIIDQMEQRGIITGYQGSKPREVLMSKERWKELKMMNPKN